VSELHAYGCPLARQNLVLAVSLHSVDFSIDLRHVIQFGMF